MGNETVPPQLPPTDAERRQQLAEALREAAERMRLSAEERRAAAEHARVTAEEERTEAERVRKAALDAVNETAGELAAILDRMKAVEKLRRTRRARSNSGDPDVN
jgi:ribosome recycling factor